MRTHVEDNVLAEESQETKGTITRAKAKQLGIKVSSFVMNNQQEELGLQSNADLGFVHLIQALTK